MKKICSKYGCNNLVNIKDKYCDDHRQEIVKQVRQWRRTYDSKRDPKYKQFYKSANWLKLRDYVLKRDNYLCTECIKSGKLTTCNTVHHIIEIREDMSKSLDQDNLTTLCYECHNKIHKRFN